LLDIRRSVLVTEAHGLPKQPISAERDFAPMGVLAYPSAELVGPPAVGDHAEAAATLIASLVLFHRCLAQQSTGTSSRYQSGRTEEDEGDLLSEDASMTNPFVRVKLF
jgi:hypothetical protein